MMHTLMLKGIRQTKQMPLRPQPCISLVANYLPPLHDAIPHPSVLLHTPSSTKIKAYHKSSLFWGDWADWTARITSLLHVMRIVDCGCRLSPTYHQNWVNSNSGNSALARHLPYWQEAALPCSAGDSLLIEEYFKTTMLSPRNTAHAAIYSYFWLNKQQSLVRFYYFASFCSYTTNTSYPNISPQNATQKVLNKKYFNCSHLPFAWRVSLELTNSQHSLSLKAPSPQRLSNTHWKE